MDTFVQDLKYGLRSLIKTKRLTFAAFACTALGIGSAVFMFTLIQSVLLRDAPFPEAERFTRVRLFATEGEGGMGDVSYLEFHDVRDQAQSFDAMEMVARSRMAVTSSEGTERVRGESVTPGYFELIGIRPAKGRLFSPDEYEPDAERVILIGDEIWKRRFGSDPEIVGKPFRVLSRETDSGYQVYTIVGVMPPGFVGTVDYDISEFWIPLEQSPHRVMFDMRAARNVWTIARLKPGVSFAAARAEVEAIGQRLAEEYPTVYEGYELRLEPFGESWRASVRTGLLMLTVAAGLLLLIACTNIASLLLARLVQREHELTLRYVLGARRGRVLRQLLIESVLLSILGGAAGTLLAFWGVKLFAATESIRLPSYVPLEPDLQVIGLAVALVLLTGVLFGVLPAWFGARLKAGQQLRDAGRGQSLGRRQSRYGQGLVVLEVMFTFVLVIGATLLLRTYVNLTNADLGFRVDNVLRMAISLDSNEYTEPQDYLDFADRAKEALLRYPGVREVTFMTLVLPPHDDFQFDMAVDGVPNEALRHVPRHAIDTDFLQVLDIELLRGRAFEPTDREGNPQVALVSESLARFIGGGDRDEALGRGFQLVTDAETQELSEPFEIVGIVEDLVYKGLRSVHEDTLTRYEIYVPLAQHPLRVLSTAIVTDGDPAALSQPLQRVLGQLAPTSPLHWISTMEEELGNQYMDARFYAFLTTGYSVCALLLAALGIYGVLANSVSRRFNELGIRMAVGAKGGDIVRLVVGQGMRTLLLGLILGGVIAILGTRLLASILYGLTPGDPTTYVAVAAILVGLGLISCYLPARRATQIDPADTLRDE